MPPVCVKCRLTMKIKKTGADVEEMMTAKAPYRIWNADIFACTSCGSEVATQFGKNPIAEHFQQDRYARFASGVAFRFWDRPEDVRIPDDRTDLEKTLAAIADATGEPA